MCIKYFPITLQTQRVGVKLSQDTTTSVKSKSISDAVEPSRTQGISVDTKKKELVGGFKNAGREWQPQGQSKETRVHDFLDKDLGKAIPSGIFV
jgi:hypothetical protein